MKIGVISDTHIPDRAKKIPEIVLEGLKNADMIVHAGDLADLETLELLKSICKDVRVVCGNMDPLELKKKIPCKEIIKIKNYKIGVMHGYGHPAKLIEVLTGEFKNDNVDVVIFGHSHNGFNEKIGGVLYFNPGSPTDKVFAAHNSYGAIEINDKIEARIIKI